MKVSQISVGRFHHFHLARQLEKKGVLDRIWTGYPKFKLEDERGIPASKIKSYPWFHTPYMKRGLIGLSNWNWLNKEWRWLSCQTLDKYVARHIQSPQVLIALSSCGLESGTKNQAIGGNYICDRGSSHIRYQGRILKEEYNLHGLKFLGIDSRITEKEEKEYLQADLITVPSEFVRRSFLEMGIDSGKLRKVSYGARLDRFSKITNPEGDVFRVLWVGGVSIRKGFLYALEAFLKLSYTKKEFIVIGTIEPILEPILKKKSSDSIKYLGTVRNQELPYWYSSSHVFVISSIEEGLAMVQGEALACGCPVIATFNTGSEDLFSDGQEGFIIPIRSVDSILEKLEILVGDNRLQMEMSEKAIARVENLGGWDKYGSDIYDVLNEFERKLF